MKVQPLTDLEIFELMQAMFPGKYSDEDSGFSSALHDWEGLLEEYFLEEIVAKVVMLTPKFESPITGEVFHALGYQDEKGFTAIIKRKAQK